MKKNKSNQEDSDRQDRLLTVLLETYLPYWPIFLITSGVFLLLAFFYLQHATPFYEATATLMVKDEKKGSEDNRMLESFTALNSKKLIENEMEVIQSYPVIDKVVRDLHLCAHLEKVMMFNNQSGYQKAPFRIEIPNPERIIAATSLALTYDTLSMSFLLGESIHILPNRIQSTPYGPIKIVVTDTTKSVLNSSEYRVTLLPLKSVVEKVLSRLKISIHNKQSSIIRLSYRDEIPARAKDILHQIIESYGQKVVSDKNALARKTIALIEQRLQSVSKNVDSIEKAVEGYKTNNNISDVSVQSQMYLQGMQSNNEELVKLNMQLSVADQLYNDMDGSGAGNNAMMMATMGIADPNLQKMMTDLNNKELEYDRLHKTVPENNPMLLALKEQINKIKPDIRNNVSSMRKSLQAGRDHLLRTGGQYQSMLQSLPAKERKVLELSRDLSVNHDMYAFLLQKKEESELSFASTLTPFQLINDAVVSSHRVSPNTILTYLSSLALALLFSTSFVYSRERLNPRILFRDELSELTQVPVLGELSINKKTAGFFIDFKQRSFEAEEFRRIRMALRNQIKDTPLRIMLLTSSIPGEGKSYISMNLAACLASAGQKVLLIDADIYQSGLSRMLPQIKEQPGFIEVIKNEKKAEDCILPFDGQTGFMLMPPGHGNIDDFDERLEAGLDDLLTELKRSYDLIIIDTPPSMLMTDAHNFANQTDAVLYVVRHNYTPKHLLQRLDDAQATHPMKNIFILFNGVHRRGFSAYGKGYGYTDANYQNKYAYHVK